MYKIFITALLFITQVTFASAADRVLNDDNVLILSPKVFVFTKDTKLNRFEILPKDARYGVKAWLSWTDNTGSRKAKIEIVKMTYSEDKGHLIFETKQWLPYTLSGEVVSLPVVLKNAELRLL